MLQGKRDQRDLSRHQGHRSPVGIVQLRYRTSRRVGDDEGARTAPQRCGLRVKRLYRDFDTPLGTQGSIACCHLFVMVPQQNCKEREHSSESIALHQDGRDTRVTRWAQARSDDALISFQFPGVELFCATGRAAQPKHGLDSVYERRSG